jgi:hypothetical protein
VKNEGSNKKKSAIKGDKNLIKKYSANKVKILTRFKQIHTQDRKRRNMSASFSKRLTEGKKRRETAGRVHAQKCENLQCSGPPPPEKGREVILKEIAPRRRSKKLLLNFPTKHFSGSISLLTDFF